MMRIKERMTNREVEDLLEDYFNKEKFVFPGYIEHRFEEISSAVMYSMIREYKPRSILAIGTWMGGSTNVIMKALLKNKLPFKYVASELLDDMRLTTANTCFQENNIVPEMIGDITKNIDKVPEEIDFLFHDSDHDRDTTDWVLNNIFPRLKKGALVIFHDWAVWEEDGKWIAKDGAWPETQYILELHEQGKLPLKKVYWNYKNPATNETGVFIKV